MAPQDSAAKAPLHLWIVGVLALLWNSMGCFDYVVTQTHNEAFLKDYPQEMLDFVYGLPSWVDAMWAFGVWGGFTGSLLLLLRKRFAAPVLLISFLGALTSMTHNYGFAGGMELMGDPFSLIMSGMILVVAAGLVMYARAMIRRGVLR